MKISYVRKKNGKRLDIRKHVGKRLDHFTVTQGSCADEKYIYMAFERKAKNRRTHAIKIVKLNAQTFEVVKVSNALQIGHANDMCIKNNTLYITHSLGSSVIHRVNATTLQKEHDIDLKEKHYNGIANYGSGFVLRVMGGKKLLILNKRFNKVRIFETNKDYKTSQGMSQKNGTIYRTYSSEQSSDKNFLRLFNKHGDLIEEHQLDITGELESCFIKDYKIWFTIYRKKKVKGKMKYYAFIAVALNN